MCILVKLKLVIKLYRKGRRGEWFIYLNGRKDTYLQSFLTLHSVMWGMCLQYNFLGKRAPGSGHNRAVSTTQAWPGRMDHHSAAGMLHEHSVALHSGALCCAISLLFISFFFYFNIRPSASPNELPMRTELGSPMTKIMSGSIIE